MASNENALPTLRQAASADTEDITALVFDVLGEYD